MQLECESTGVNARELEEVVDEQRKGRTCSRRTGTYSPGSPRPSSSASSIACMLASGVRRSWLAQATSSRRVSKRRPRFAPISLKDAASSATSAGPPSGARASRFPPANSTDASASVSYRVGDRARHEERCDERRQRRRRRDGEDLHVVAHVKHHPPRREHRAQRQQDRENREAGQLEPNGGQQTKKGCESEPDPEGRRARRQVRSRSCGQPVSDTPNRL